MLCLHPTHFELGKAQLLGLGGKVSRWYAHELAERGFVCLVPDYPGFAEYKYDFDANTDRFGSGTMKAIWNNSRNQRLQTLARPFVFPGLPAITDVPRDSDQVDMDLKSLLNVVGYFFLYC